MRCSSVHILQFILCENNVLSSCIAVDTSLSLLGGTLSNCSILLINPVIGTPMSFSLFEQCIYSVAHDLELHFFLKVHTLCDCNNHIWSGPSLLFVILVSVSACICSSLFS